MNSNKKSATTAKKKNSVTQILLEPVKWVGANIILPFLPIALKMLVNCFSTSSADVLDPNDLLYYNFFICMLLLDLVKERNTIFKYIVSLLMGGICLVDILLIGFIATGQHNIDTIQPFAIRVAIICACLGSIFVIGQALLNSKQEVE